MQSKPELKKSVTSVLEWNDPAWNVERFAFESFKILVPDHDLVCVLGPEVSAGCDWLVAHQKGQLDNAKLECVRCVIGTKVLTVYNKYMDSR